jgi:quercetin dioxygenase-like cupin family protein
MKNPLKLAVCFLPLSLSVFLAAALWLHGESPKENYRPEIRVTSLLRTSMTTCGQPIAYPQVAQPEVTALLVEIPPGAETGWHLHPVPCYAYILSGSLSVEMAGGKTFVFNAGQALAEIVNTLHNGKNTGTEPVKLVLFVTGEKDVPFTVRSEKINP